MFFRTALSCSGGYHPEKGGIPLHDAVGINCEKSATTENQGAGVKYMGKGVFSWMIVCVLSDLSFLALWPVEHANHARDLGSSPM